MLCLKAQETKKVGEKKGGDLFKVLQPQLGSCPLLGSHARPSPKRGRGTEGPSATTLSLLRQKVNKHSRC